MKKTKRLSVCDSKRPWLLMRAHVLLLFPVLGQGGKPKYEKKHPCDGKERQPSTDFTPYRNHESPESLIPQDFRACLGKKKDHADCIKTCVAIWS